MYRPMMNALLRSLRMLGWAALTIPLAGCSWGLLRGYAEGPSAVLEGMAAQGRPTGATRFAFDELGALNTDALRTHAIPWKVLVAALLTDRRGSGDTTPLEESAVVPVLQEFGFILPNTVLNTGGAPWPGELTTPLGLLRGNAKRGFPAVEVELMNLGCAACHAGVTYDADGAPRMEVWLGLPNTSLNLNGFTEAVYSAFSNAMEHPGRLEAALDTLYPGMSQGERSTLERHVLPGLERDLVQRRDHWAGLTPYSPGGPGTANGLGALMHILGFADDEESPIEPGAHLGVGGAVAIPDLGDRMLKSSFAVDGTFGLSGAPRFQSMTKADLTDEMLNARAEVVAFFAVPTMGLAPDRVSRIVPRARDIVGFLAEYRPPPFPGPVDPTLVAEGEQIYRDGCAVCHGERAPRGRHRDIPMERFANIIVPMDEIATDPSRWRAATPELAAAIARTPAASRLAVGPTAGYMAPPLTGLWATAPYLHNGSVPTLWHLMHPEARPSRFEVGGHRLDFERFGIDGRPDDDGVYRYPEAYVPWAKPVVYDTTLPGQGNGGHASPFDKLSEGEKRALTEYLKLL